MRNKTSLLLVLALLLMSLPIFASKTAIQETTSDVISFENTENTIKESQDLASTEKPISENEESSAEKMANLVIQLGIIIIAAKFGGILFSKIKMPSVLGELCTGIIIGPYLLGALHLPGFPHGIFPIVNGAAVSSELYAISQIASIILLFLSGMETDLSLFLRYSVVGSIIGLCGALVSFFIGAYCTLLLTPVFFGFHLDGGIMNPLCLFMGVLSTATSVGITARIFSDNHKMDSHEGVTILAAAVIDDVLGIIFLAIVVGIVGAQQAGNGSSVNWGQIGLIGLKAFGVWLGATVLGLFLAKYISKFLKCFKSVTTFSIMAVALAFLLSGFFEKQGLAMIIGAYVMGLTISKTDLSFVIQDNLHTIYNFFVPVFFVVMGMMVDVSTLFQPKVLAFGGIFTVLAIIAKVVGCGFPALFANFNMMGALRIGMGMVPRGEVALIIAGIGMASGVLAPDFFSIAILMTLLTTLIPPPIISLIINLPIKGIRKETKEIEATTIEYNFASKDVREVVSEKIVEEFKSEGCFISRVYLDNIVYRITRNDISVSLQCSEDKIVISCDKADVVYVKNIVFEAFLEIHNMFEHLKDLSKPEEMKKELVKMEEPARTDLNILNILHKENIIVDLQGNTKEEIIRELIEKLDISDDERKTEIFNAVMEREALSSTGMEDGIAIPHGKINADINISAVIGLKKDGIDFNSLDGQPSQIFVLLVSPASGNAPHIQALASISNILSNPNARKELIAGVSVDQIWDSLVRFSKK